MTETWFTDDEFPFTISACRSVSSQHPIAEGIGVGVGNTGVGVGITGVGVGITGVGVGAIGVGVGAIGVGVATCFLTITGQLSLSSNALLSGSAESPEITNKCEGSTTFTFGKNSVSLLIFDKSN